MPNEDLIELELGSTLTFSKWLAIGAQDQIKAENFLSTLSNISFECIDLRENLSSVVPNKLGGSIYEMIFTWLKNYQKNNDQPVRLIWDLTFDQKTKHIKNIDLMCNFLQSAKGIWELEFNFELWIQRDCATFLKAIEEDLKNLLSCLVNTKSLISINKFQANDPSPEYIKQIILLNKFCIEEFEIILYDKNSIELTEYAQAIRKLHASSLKINLACFRGEHHAQQYGLSSAESAGTFLAIIAENHHIRKLILNAES
jgi:hypothetical protein